MHIQQGSYLNLIALPGNLPYGQQMETQPISRFEARVPTHVLAVIKHAADMQGRTMTDFVMSAAQQAAEQAIEKTNVIRLSMEDSRKFAEALLNPPEPTPALVEAFRLSRELFGDE
jgi:uncharacterized protein (DUF1778 family)